jgi:hypothetical protein
MIQQGTTHNIQHIHSIKWSLFFTT